tara:strand:+ start:545 stop:1132 length:588 start_codon:yes stop_codon:yes gene_type:complete
MSKIETNTIAPSTGTTLTLGESGDTVQVGTGATASGFGGITMADQWRVTTAFSGDAAPIANNWERNDTAPSLSYFGSQMSESSGIFTFPSTGIYEIHFMIQYKLDGSDSVANQSFIQGTTNNSSYVNLTEASTNIIHGGSGDLYSSSTQTALVDITDTSTHKVRFSVSLANSGVEMSANTARDILAVRFIRLGDT